MLEVSNLSKEFGGLLAVDQVTFRIDEGEMVGLIGPNGAGKTTLFNCVTGVLTPDRRSEVRFHGQDVLGMKPHRIPQLGLVRTFQIVRVFDEMTVFDNVLAGATFATKGSIDQKIARERALESLSFIGLEERRDQEAGALPLAQKKQLEVARVLASDPDMIMLDEIASGLTPKEVGALSDTIRRIRDDRGIAVFWIEHIMEAIMDTVDRILVINSGELIANGPPEDVRNDEHVIEAYLGTSA